jgi:uncharacterized OsmC-like protein
MDGESLRARQAPLKEQYRGRPETAVITLTAEGDIDDAGIACKVQTGRALVTAGLHPATGGSGLVACAGVTLKAVATAIGIELSSARVRAEGDLDFRGTLGVDREAPVGFRDIRLIFELSSDASQEQLDQLLKLTERYCVVLQTLRSGPPASASLIAV